MADFDRALSEQDAYEIEAADGRRLILDAEQEQYLQARNADGRQTVIQPPIGTVGGPPVPPGDDVTTSETRSIHAGGGPGDPTRMPDDGGQHGAGGTGRTGMSADDGIGASPNPQ